MKSPSGFGKNYFTFSAILAYSVQNKLNAQVSSIHSLFFNATDKEDDEIEEEELPPDILNPLCILNTKPCHCNCFYKIRTKLTLLCNKFIPRCPYYTTYFAFRRSGVHPPKTLLFSN